MSFRFLHTADWQVGKPFGGIPGDAGSELRSQRIRTVRRIAEVAREHAVDAVLVAGDAFDSNDVKDRTLMLTLEALAPFDGLWVFLPGNHDAAQVHSVWTRLRDMSLPPNVLIADTPVPIDRWGGAAHILPAPLTRRRETLDLTAWYDDAPTPEGSWRVGLAHGSVAGRLPERSDATNEIPDDRAERSGLSYLALGDWHGALQIAPRTWYAGTPEPDRHRNNEPGSVHIVALGGSVATAEVVPVSVGHYRWLPLDIELRAGTAAEVDAELLRQIAEPRRAVVALTLSGAISLEERRRLDGILRQWDARLHHLTVEDAALRDEPTADDLDAIDTAGFVRAAIDHLRARAVDSGDPEHEAARLALRLAYLDHRGQA